MVIYMLSPHQEDYFKDSKIRNSEGELIPCYHGTPFGDFDAFTGYTFFFDEKSPAEYFTQQRHHGCLEVKPATYECYLNSKYPFVFDANGSRYNQLKLPDYIVEELVKNNREYLSFSFDVDDFREVSLEQATKENMLYDYEVCFPEYYSEHGASVEELISYAESHGYDGLIINNVVDLNDDIARTQYVVFEPNQIKSVDNLYPTSSDRFKQDSLFDIISKCHSEKPEINHTERNDFIL